MAAAKAGGLGDGLDGAGLVVGEHEAEESRGFGEEAVEGFKVGGAGLVDWEDGGAGSGGADGVVLGCADDNAAGGGERGDSEGVGLGAAGGEDEADGAGAETGSDGAAGGFQQGTGSAAGSMDARRVAHEVYGLDDGVASLGAEGFRGVGIEVNSGFLLHVWVLWSFTPGLPWKGRGKSGYSPAVERAWMAETRASSARSSARRASMVQTRGSTVPSHGVP